IGVGLGVGWKVAPFVVHRRLFWKLVGILGCLLYVAWTFGFNLLVAHYRHTLGLVGLGVAQPEQAGRIAFESWLAHPFGVTDIQAWLLFALGCAFSLIAATDGWTMDDPYPGYGALARHQTKLIDEYIDQKKSLMDELQKVRDAALEKMESTARDIERRQAEYHPILGNR